MASSKHPSQEHPPTPGPESTPTNTVPAEVDATRKQVLMYAVGNIESGIANNFFAILNVVSVVALGMSPMLMGLIISIKTLWEGITDPIMAQITDNARTRWGRRIPFILTGGVTRVLFLLVVFLAFPRDSSIKPNSAYQEEKAAREAVTAVKPPTQAESAPATKDGESAKNEAQPAAPAPHPPPPGLLASIKAGFNALTTTENPYHRTVFYYLLFASMMFALLGTLQSVPYYALGIELCPSYDGRTRVVTYRSVVDKLMNLVVPWILPFCFLPIFTTVLDGLVWYAVFVCVIGIPTTVAMCVMIKERNLPGPNSRRKGPSLFKSIWLTARNIHFLKILGLYLMIGFTNGISAQFDIFIVIYYIFKGDVLGGTVMNGYAATFATCLAIGSLPLVNWACRRFSKHATLRAAIIWMSLGAIMKWFLYDPRFPWLILVLPFFFAIGISSVYTILPSLMADVTDLDELQNGTRREGMFGAVMAFLNKALSSFQPVLSAAVLLFSGFLAHAGGDQTPETLFRMRLMASWIPGGLLMLALVFLWRYPVTRERMEEVKAKLRVNRAARAQTEACENPAHGNA